MPLQPVDSIDPREWGHADMMLFRSLVAELAKMRDTNASLFLVFEKAIKSMASLTDAELQELSKSGTTELVRKLLGLE